MNRYCLACTGVAFAIATANATASPLVYKPINPSFGGNPLNGSFLLNEAQAQNNLTDPSSANGSLGITSPQTPLQQFNSTLEQMVLSRVASGVSNNLFSSTGQLVPGHVETSGFTIDIVNAGGGMLRITTTDKTTGATTSFEVNSQP